MRSRALLPLAFAGLLACGTLMHDADQELSWYRGNTHTHTLWSDGNAAPEMVVRWYRDHGYDFLALSEHNVLATSERWRPIAPGTALSPGRVETLRLAFGPGWVETRTTPEGTTEMRLKTLEDLRQRFESSFLMIDGEEVSDSFEGRPIHINALNLGAVIPPQHGDGIVDTLQRNFDAIAAEEERVGRPVLAHLNHPNFRWVLTAEEIAQIRGETFFEVYNGHPVVNNRGDHLHPGAEKMWDIALTLRLTELDLGLLYGVAVDDAHQYYIKGSNHANPGRGWVMVRAERLRAGSLIRAMKRGDFYASSGVTLEDVRRSRDGLELRIATEPGVTYETSFVGTRMNGDAPGEPGVVLLTTAENPARYEFEGDELYVRAKVTSSREHPNPSQEGDLESAWTQPVKRR